MCFPGAWTKFRILELCTLLIFFLISSFSSAQNLRNDLQIGKEYAERVEKIFGVYDDPKMSSYVKNIGERLISAMDEPLFDYSFKIIPSATPNAFALPGGFTYVTTGLLPVLESEDELACIMAHEIIHANNRHSIKSMKRGIIPAILQLPGNIIGLVSPGAGEMINRPIKGFGDLGMASYSRKNETEADVEGSALAAKAGYNPEALQSALIRIGKYIELLTGEKEKKGYLDDHPMTDDRVKRLKKEAEKLDFKRTAPLSASFVSEWEGLIYGDNPKQGLILDSVFYNPEYGFRLTIPEGWVGQVLPNTFAMTDSTRRASIYISYSQSDSTPGEKAEAIRNQLPDQYKQIMVLDQEVQVNNEPAYMMAFEQRTSESEVYAFLLWLKKGATLFEFSSMTRPELRKTIERIPYTLAPLNLADKKKVKVERMELLVPLQNETIGDFNLRTSNTLSEEVTILINELNTGETLPTEKQIKVVLKEPYFEK